MWSQINFKVISCCSEIGLSWEFLYYVIMESLFLICCMAELQILNSVVRTKQTNSESNDGEEIIKKVMTTAKQVMGRWLGGWWWLQNRTSTACKVCKFTSSQTHYFITPSFREVKKRSSTFLWNLFKECFTHPKEAFYGRNNDHNNRRLSFESQQLGRPPRYLNIKYCRTLFYDPVVWCSKPKYWPIDSTSCGLLVVTRITSKDKAKFYLSFENSKPYCKL